MRVATFNVNGVNRRIGNLLDWLAATSPDAVCLQELKSTDQDFPHQALREAGYAAVCHGQKTWNGVAILARGEQPPVVTRRGLPGDPADIQSRYIEAAVDGVLSTPQESHERALRLKARRGQVRHQVAGV